MRALQWNLADWHDFVLARGIMQENAVAARESAQFYFLLAAEPVGLRLDAVCHPYARGVIRIEHREIVTGLVLENALLSGCVGFHAAVAVEMVGRNVQHDGHEWTERLDRLQLEAGDLKNVVVIVGGGGDQRNRGCSDVATDLRRLSTARDDLAG